MADTIPTPIPNPPVGVATKPQAFYTSKTFWTLSLAFVGNVLVQANVLPVTTDFQTYSNLAMLVLAGIFRWTADQPLAVTAPK